MRAKSKPLYKYIQSLARNRWDWRSVWRNTQYSHLIPDMGYPITPQEPTQGVALRRRLVRT